MGASSFTIARSQAPCPIQFPRRASAGVRAYGAGLRAPLRVPCRNVRALRGDDSRRFATNRVTGGPKFRRLSAHRAPVILPFF
jgi:hypothetical protein